MWIVNIYKKVVKICDKTIINKYTQLKCIQNNNTRYVNLAQLAMKSCAIQIFHISFRFTLILICTNKKQQKLHSKFPINQNAKFKRCLCYVSIINLIGNSCEVCVVLITASLCIPWLWILKIESKHFQILSSWQNHSMFKRLDFWENTIL